MSTDFKDYYRVLEIVFEASEADIKTAYRKLARECHPDLHPENTDYYTQQFRAITEAYETLSNPVKKENYDFLYRQYVLKEVPQYEYYYHDDTPENTADYQHTYTKRNKIKVSYFPVIMLFFLGFQFLRWISDVPPITPAEMSRKPYQVEEIQHYIRDSMEHKDTSYYFPAGKK